MDMASGNALFAAPEPILQDMALSQLHQEFYGFDLGIGTGYIDACHPGAQSAAEKTLKITAAFFAGKTNYPVGILAGGKTFCPEEAMLELEIAKTIHKLYGGLVVNDETLAVDVIQSVGIAGNFLAHDHTLKHFREALLISRIFDRSAGAQEDVLKRANRMWKEILATAVPYALPEDKGREIARIVAKAEKFFTA
jgi:trimethylamine--corrinoid protein Co-methyltransferase